MGQCVLVSSTNRDAYVNGDLGTVIPESDVLAYYVWIPRYKYKVWNKTRVMGTDSYNAKDTGIDIAFESGTETTGKITCKDYSFTKPTANKRNQYCSGNNGQFYTHPAFSFGDTEVEGIWVGKFEISSKNNIATIKPNQQSMLNETVSYYYKVIKDIQKANNAYGLDTDTSKVDSHMVKKYRMGSDSISNPQ